MSPFRTIAALVLATTTLALAPAAYAEGQDSQKLNSATQDRPQHDRLSAETQPTTGGVTSAAAPSTSIPSNCWGYTDDPHKSSAFASVHGRTECPSSVTNFVNINLFRERWWGWEHLANGSDGPRVAQKTNANAKWYCSGVGTYTWRGESYHRVTIGGTNYVAYTANDSRWTC